MKAINKAKSMNRIIMNRIGYNYIYEQLEQSGSFNGHRATPHQSVRAIPFEMAVGKISLQNATIT